MTESRRYYLNYLKSKVWKSKRHARLIKDRWQCNDCQATNNLEVHHLTYERFGNEDIEDLITLCHDCHVIAHKIKESSHD